MSATQERPVAEIPLDVREQLVAALELDLVGPWHGHRFDDEDLPGWIRPSTWYLTGFLIPSGTPPEQSADADEDEDLDEVPESEGLAEESSEERKAAKKGYFPSSLGLSFLVREDARLLAVTIRWGDYRVTEQNGEDEDEEEERKLVWQRQAREAAFEVPLKGRAATTHDVGESGGLKLHVVERPVVGAELEDRIPPGSRSVSVFLVNDRPPDLDTPDAAYAFQAQVEVRCDVPFVPRPDLRGALASDWDERVADLHYADAPEYATGHGVSADWELVDGGCRLLRTTWIPTAEVEKTQTASVPDVELGMAALGLLADGAAARAALQPMVGHYRAWIAARSEDLGHLAGQRRETAQELLRLAGIASDRIERGIDVLAGDADALDAFRLANRAVARALRVRLDLDAPAWRPFQLAFLLLNVPGIADPRDPHRDTVDLLFFPTGGGKTEAYLGLAAFAMVLRRLRHRQDDGLAGAGVSVIMRYTLRLLTLDQLARAAATASGRSRLACGSARQRRPTR